MMHLDRLLTEISEALRAGQFERLSTLSAMLDTVLPPQDPVSLRTIARIARENALTLAAAAKVLISTEK